MKERICDAIEADKLLKFEYNDHRREVKPFIVLRSQEGKISVGGVQVGGTSESGSMPFWRTFNLEAIDSIDVVEGPDSVHGSDKVMPATEDMYNPDDDRYEEVICAKDESK